MTTTLHALAEHGQSPWIDFLSRPFVRDGDLAGLIEKGIAGVTSNPTIFQGGDRRRRRLRRAAARGARDRAGSQGGLPGPGPRGHPRRLRPAPPVLRRGDSTRDGWVSLEVDPNLAHDARAPPPRPSGSARDGRPPQPVREDPGHRGGSEAIEETIAAGIPVNVTLLFSLSAIARPREAYLRRPAAAARRAAATCRRWPRWPRSSSPASTPRPTGAWRRSAATTISRASWRSPTPSSPTRPTRSCSAGAEWEELEAAGASPQRCLWASTSAKNPDYRDLLYVESLIGPATVNTMPRETVEALLDHGQVEPTRSRRDVDEAKATFDAPRRSRASTTTMSSRCSSARACRSSPTRSGS